MFLVTCFWVVCTGSSKAWPVAARYLHPDLLPGGSVPVARLAAAQAQAPRAGGGLVQGGPEARFAACHGGPVAPARLDLARLLADFPERSGLVRRGSEPCLERGG